MGQARHFVIGFVGLTGLMLSLSRIALTQEKKPAPKKPAPIAPAEKLEDGWDEIDQRLVFLMVRLANAETTLEAVEKAIAESSRQQSKRTGDAKRSEKKNEEMDRKGGGPVRWDLFYGRTAEKFFYHPTTRNTTYHTETILTQKPPEDDNQVAPGVPSRQGLPVHQRPPQFDYIYRANETSKARAEDEVNKLRNKMDSLLERRHRLEAEQNALWCDIAFRAVAHYDLQKKPLYRFEPLVKGVDTDERQHAEVMKSAAVFVRLALSIVDAAQKDQATTFKTIKTTVSDAREKLDDTWLRQDIDASNKKTPEGKFAALAKRLDDVASNLSDSYEVAAEGDREKDQQRKDIFRGLLQESLVSYAQVVLALDEMSVQMRDQWKIKPDLDKPIAFASVPSIEKGKRPDINGDWWNGVDGEDRQTMTIIQKGGQFTGTCVFQNPKAGEIRWTLTGTITDEGRISGRLVHTKAPKTWKNQEHIAVLTPDGKTIKGRATFDGGGAHDYVWIRLAERNKAKP